MERNSSVALILLSFEYIRDDYDLRMRRLGRAIVGYSFRNCIAILPNNYLGTLAQLGEHERLQVGVAGSIPVVSTF